jgi:hypothetical protein
VAPAEGNIDLVNPVVVTGGSGAFAGMTWDVTTGNTAPVVPNIEIINPKTGVDVLATVKSDPNDTGTNKVTAVVVGNKNVGAAGTSTVIYVGFPVEDISGGSPNTQAQFFSAIQAYVTAAGGAL